MNTTAFVVFIGTVTGFVAYGCMVKPDVIMGFLFGVVCCMAAASVYLADKITENQREMARIDAQLAILEELQS